MQRDSQWPEKQPGATIDLWGYLDTFLDAVWRRWWLVVLAMLISAGYSVHSLANQVPVFSATATVLIEPPSTNVLDLGQMLQARRGTDAFTETQIQLLRSRAFIEFFLARENMLPERRASGTGEERAEDAGSSDPTAEPSPPAPTEADQGVSDSPEPDGSLLASLGERVSDAWQAARQAVSDLMSPITGSGEQPGLDESELPEELRDRRLAGAVNRVRSAMSVQPVEGTRLVDISWRARDRVYATKMVNAAAEAFIAYNLETQARLSEQASETLNTGMDRLRAEIRQDEERLDALRDRLGIEESATELSRTSTTLGAELAAARAERVELEADHRRLRDLDPAGAPAIGNDPDVRRLRDRLARLRSEREELSRRLTDQHPQMRDLLDRISEAGGELRQAEEAAYRDLLRQRQQEAQAAREAEQQLRSLAAGQSGVREDQYDDLMELQALQASLENKRSLLEQLIDRKSTLEITSQVTGQQGASVQIVEPPVLPGRPANKQWLRTILMAMAMGAAVGSAIAVGLDYLDNTLRTPEDVERRLGLTTLGTVSAVNDARSKKVEGDYVEPLEGQVAAELVASEKPRSRVAEEYRELRTALLLSTGGGPPRSLVLTSATPGEGKTTSAVNLAFSLADAGKKVLLIDGDLRRPRVGDILGLGKVDGFSNYLAGNASWENLIRKTRSDSLLVLPSGPIPPNPAELFGSDLPRTLLEEAGEHFDIVIIDSPPALTVVDALMLASLAEGVAVVVRANRTAHQLVAKAIGRLEDVQGRVLGIVLNASERKGRLGYGRYGYYYNQYGYGYRYSSRSE